jgi:ABC-2 type transport system ATP-binding protein
VAILPRWLKVKEAIDFVEGIHPRFDRAKAERYIAHTRLAPDMRVKAMSKGMIVQLHLALVMAIDAKLLVLDEPTLGLDILYRKAFYQNLLEDYFDEHKTIVITTHQIEEVEHILTDVLFIREGRIALAALMIVAVLGVALTGHNATISVDGVPKQQLENLGELRTPSVADLFVASMQGSY